jgi:hypothetical protein
MNANRSLERQLADLYAAEGKLRAPDQVLASALNTIGSTTQRRVIGTLLGRLPWRFRDMNRYFSVAAVAVAVVVVASIGFALYASRPAPPVTSPTRAPTASPTPSPSSTESLTWTTARIDHGWPGSVRSEPPDGGEVITMALAGDARWTGQQWEPFEYRDQVGDVGDDLPWLDISAVHLTPGDSVTGFDLQLAGDLPIPRPEPAERWIAYGVVLDVDGDGAADVRIGMDNFEGQDHRAWRTDLRSGRTNASAGPPYGFVGPDRVGLDTYFPEGEAPAAVLRYSPQEVGEVARFYGWASVIEAGKVVATDYAPDTGWLVAGEDPGLPLVGTRWIVGYDFAGGSRSIEYTLRFENAHTFSIDTCRPGTGIATVGPSSMRVTDFRLSENTCSQATLEEIEEFEASVLGVLSADQISYIVDAGVLELRAGDTVVRFNGQPAAND